MYCRRPFMTARGRRRTVHCSATADYRILQVCMYMLTKTKRKKDRRLVHPRAAKQGRTDCHLPWRSLAGNTGEEGPIDPSTVKPMERDHSQKPMERDTKKKKSGHAIVIAQIVSFSLTARHLYAFKTPCGVFHPKRAVCETC